MLNRIWRLVFRVRPDTFDEVQKQLQIEVLRLQAIATQAKIEAAEYVLAGNSDDSDFAKLHRTVFAEDIHKASQKYELAKDTILEINKLIIKINDRKEDL